MKKSVLIVLIILCAVLLASCCKHETWQNADCENPKVCVECGETEGEPLGHTWADATCTAAKTCSACQKTEGAALGHTWVDAGCETPKTCQTCALTEGEPLGHTWVDATTEAPQTCTVCSKTEGERIITDSRFTTAACQPLFGTWVFSTEITGDMMELEGFSGHLDASIYVAFSNDGKFEISIEVKEPEGFDAALKTYMVDLMYDEFEVQGVSKADADAAMKDAYGMTVEEYVDLVVKNVDFPSMFEGLNAEGCYYVKDSTLYSADEWTTDMEATPFKFQGEALIIEGFTEALGVDEGNFTRVPDSES